MRKGTCSCLTLAVLAALFWCVEPREAAAETYYLENATSFSINVALLMPTTRGWYSTHWYSLAPYSRKRVSKNWALRGKFGYYAEGRGNMSGTKWRGRAVAIVSDRGSEHPYNVNPGGRNARKVGFQIKNGNAVRFTYSGGGGGGGGMAPPGNW